jgi:hypothetical protein
MSVSVRPGRPVVVSLLVATGVFAAPLAWYVLQQGAGGLVYARCDLAAPPWAALAGAAVTLACAGLAVLSRRVGRRTGLTPAQAFLLRVGCGCAIIFTLGSIALTAALALERPCG